MTVWVSHSNEWREGTQIETSAGHGDAYLNLTAELAAAYRQGAAAVPDVAQPASAPATDTPEATEEPQPTAPPATETPAPAPSPSPTTTGTPTPTPTATASPTPTPAPTRTLTPTPSPSPPDTPTPSPTPTPMLADRAATRPWGGWVMSAAVALLALGAVAWALRLQGDVAGRTIEKR